MRNQYQMSSKGWKHFNKYNLTNTLYKYCIIIYYLINIINHNLYLNLICRTFFYPHHPVLTGSFPGPPIGTMCPSPVVMTAGPSSTAHRAPAPVLLLHTLSCEMNPPLSYNRYALIKKTTGILCRCTLRCSWVGTPFC